MKTKEMKQNRNFLAINISVILLLIAMALSNVAFAQPGGQQGPPPIPNTKEIKKIVTELSTELSMSEDQESEVLELYTNHFADVKKATSNGRPDRTAMENLKSTFEKEVKEVLSNDQQKLYTKYLKKNPQQQQQRRR